MAARKNVPAAEVRNWLKSEAGQAAIAGFNEKATPKDVVTTHVGSRGRLHPVHRDLFSKAHKGKTYVEKAAEVPTREFKFRSTDKRGRTITKTERMTLAEARAFIGKPEDKGRLKSEDVVAALEARAGFVLKEESKVEKD